MPSKPHSPSGDKRPGGEINLSHPVTADGRTPLPISPGAPSSAKRNSYQPRIKFEENVIERSVYCQTEGKVPVRAAYHNRANCDMITCNYEEAFGQGNLHNLEETSPLRHRSHRSGSIVASASPQLSMNGSGLLLAAPAARATSSNESKDELETHALTNPNVPKLRDGLAKDETIGANPESYQSGFMSVAETVRSSSKHKLSSVYPPSDLNISSPSDRPHKSSKASLVFKSISPHAAANLS